MNLKETILKEHSKTQRNEVVNWVGSTQRRFDEVVDLMLGNDRVLAQRAAWAVSYCVEAHPLLIQKQLGRLIDNLNNPDAHDAVLRNSVRMLESLAIPEKYHGTLMDCCFLFLASPTAAIAIKAFSMGILCRLAQTYPEIIPEIKLLMADQLPNASAGFKSRSKMVLKQLDSY